MYLDPKLMSVEVGIVSEFETAETQLLGHYESKVKWFSDSKGYGFISHVDNSDIFVHHSAIKMDGYRTLQEGDDVDYEIMKSIKALQAANVQPSSNSGIHRRKQLVT
jgi:cold shock protein